MYIYSKNKLWEKSGSLSDALLSVFTVPIKIAVIGSGGKSSTIDKLTEEQRAKGRKVLVITTTHIAEPKNFGVINGSAEEIKKALERDGIVYAGTKNDEGKLSFIGDLIYNEVKNCADVILVEADGSKRLPVKVPAEWEPVILPDTDLIVTVFGLSALGKAGKDICHRWERAEKFLMSQNNSKNDNDSDFSCLKPSHLCTLLQEGYLKPLRSKYPNIPIIPVLNQADNEDLAKTGMQMIDDICENRGLVMSFLK